VFFYVRCSKKLELTYGENMTVLLIFLNGNLTDSGARIACGVALGYGLDDWEFVYQHGLEIFLFTTMSKPALGPTQPPLQWAPRALSLVVKQPGHESDHSPPSSSEVKECVVLYIHSPNMPLWHGAQLKKSTGTNLPLPYLIDLLWYERSLLEAEH
jgi:hypothetical protein